MIPTITDETILPYVSVVVIGRNEAINLSSCIQSIREMDYPQSRLEVIYVDTDSTDGSPDVARALGVTVYEEHSDYPSPGKARNRGLREAKYEIIHFLDGDMRIDHNWLRDALPVLLNDPKIAGVFGRVHELGTSIYDRAIGSEWETRPEGVALAPGGGGLFKANILREVDGYSSILVAAEETELGERLRKAGYKIICVNAVMANHELGLSSLGQYWKRWMRAGRSRFQLLKQFGRTYLRFSTIKPMLFTALLAIWILLSLLISQLFIFLCIVLMSAIVRYAVIRNKALHDWRLSLIVSVENYLRMIPITIGFVSSWFMYSVSGNCNGKGK